MTRERLEELVRATVKEAKREFIASNKTFVARFRYYLKDGSCTDLTVPEDAAAIMSDGVAKEILFDILRKTTEATPEIEAWVFITHANWGRSTEKGAKQPVEAVRSMDLDEMAARGWAIVEESLMVSGQTPEHMVMAAQVYTRQPVFAWLGLDVKVFPAANFSGRQKMWNATREDVTGGWKERKGAKTIGVDFLDLLKVRRQ